RHGADGHGIAVRIGGVSQYIERDGRVLRGAGADVAAYRDGGVVHNGDGHGAGVAEHATIVDGLVGKAVAAVEISGGRVGERAVRVHRERTVAGAARGAGGGDGAVDGCDGERVAQCAGGVGDDGARRDRKRTGLNGADG